MAGGKRGEESGGGNLAKKKRRSTAGKRLEESDDEKPSAEETSKPVSKSKVTGSTSGSVEKQAVQQPAAQQPLLGGDNLGLLKERFNSLHSVRFTEPEKQCAELLNLLEEQKSTQQLLVDRLQTRIQTLEQQTKEIGELKKRELQLIEENATVRGQVETVRKSLELADQERAALLKALENVNRSTRDTADFDQMVSLLDSFRHITGITLQLDEEDKTLAHCTIYNQQTKKGVRFSVSFSRDRITFTPTANKVLLPQEIRRAPTELPKEEAPAFVAKVMNAMFLS